MAWLPEGENIFEDMFISFDGIHEHERDRRTDTARRHRTQHRAAKTVYMFCSHSYVIVFIYNIYNIVKV